MGIKGLLYDSRNDEVEPDDAAPVMPNRDLTVTD